MAPDISLNATTGFPRPEYSTSYWLAHNTPSPLTGHNATTALPHTSAEEPADVVVVGSGISGAFAAYNLLNPPDGRAPPKSVVLLEAREVCSGATGRNGGHCRPDRFAGFLGYASIVGQEQAHKVLDNEVETLAYLLSTAEKEKIECDLWTGETLAVYLTEKMRDSAKASYDAYKAYGKVDESQVSFVEDPETARKISRTKSALALAKWPAASLYPHKLVSALLQLCLDKGLKLYSQAPVDRVEKQGNLWSVTVSRSKGKEVVSTKKLLLATNAYTAALRPEFQQHIFPIQEWCSALAPSKNFSSDPVAEEVSGAAKSAEKTASPILSAGTLQYTMCLFTDDHAFEYLVPRQEGTDKAWILGGGQESMSMKQLTTSSIDDSNGAVGKEAFGSDRPTAQKMRDYFAAYPDRQFTSWENNEDTLERLWTGIIGMSRDTLPYIGQIEPGLFACVGFHGHGMARAATCGRGVAQLVLHSLSGQVDELEASEAQWEELTGLPGCFRWTESRKARRDINHSVYQPSAAS